MGQAQPVQNIKISARGWCYLLEQHGEITKGEFDAAVILINQCHKNGLLPIDICAEDERRTTDGIEELDGDVDEMVDSLEEDLLDAPNNYTPISFWVDKPYYVEMAVEQVDLKSLFGPTCQDWHVPITNWGGWSDLRSRTNTLVRMYLQWIEESNAPVLLYCGDHDPGGLIISGFLRDNLRDMAGAAALLLRRNHDLSTTTAQMERFVDEIIIDRFGLNYDFIEATGLTWIDNLETGSGKNLASPDHEDHFKSSVQDYIRQFGPRKCEANALVVNPTAARELCRQAILQYIDANALNEYEERLQEPRDELQQAIYDKFGVGDPPEDDDEQ
jgi:hypothetical protein